LEKNQAFSFLSSHQEVVNYAISRQDNLRSYVGFVLDTMSTESTEMIEGTRLAILCKADNPGTIYPAIPIYQNGQLACARGTSNIEQTKSYWHMQY
jgi:hypothetical protein